MNAKEAIELLGFEYLPGGIFLLPDRFLLKHEIPAVVYLEGEWDYEFITKNDVGHLCYNRSTNLWRVTVPI